MRICAEYMLHTIEIWGRLVLVSGIHTRCYRARSSVIVLRPFLLDRSLYTPLESSPNRCAYYLREPTPNQICYVIHHLQHIDVMGFYNVYDYISICTDCSLCLMWYLRDTLWALAIARYKCLWCSMYTWIWATSLDEPIDSTIAFTTSPIVNHLNNYDKLSNHTTNTSM